jgi:hypothetical protein
MENPRDVIGSSIYMAALAASQDKCKCRTCQIMRKAAPALIEMFLEDKPKAAPGNPLATPPGEVVNIPDEGDGD